MKKYYVVALDSGRVFSVNEFVDFNKAKSFMVSKFVRMVYNSHCIEDLYFYEWFISKFEKRRMFIVCETCCLDCEFGAGFDLIEQEV